MAHGHAHDHGDRRALAIALLLIVALMVAAVAHRPARGHWTFGFRRVEVLAAQANGIALLLVGAWIVYSAVRRLVSPPDVRGGLLLPAARAGALGRPLRAGPPGGAN